MTARLSPQREAEIVARAEAATPGPWQVEKDYCDCSEYGCSHPPFVVAFGPFTSFENTTDRHHYDADFAGHAREDVPALLAEVERQRAELAAVRAERDRAMAALHDAADQIAERDDEIGKLSAELSAERSPLKQRVARAIYALPSPSPSSSEHYRSGWDVGLEASVDAARTALDGEATS